VVSARCISLDRLVGQVSARCISAAAAVAAAVAAGEQGEQEKERRREPFPVVLG
jgi:hypothetical protein